MNNTQLRPMKGRTPKTIKKLLKMKLDDWIDSIEDLEVQKAVKSDVIVTGGSIASMLLGENVNDYDLYFKTYKTTLLVANYYTTLFNNSNPNELSGFVECGEDSRIRICVNSDGVTSEAGYNGNGLDEELEEELNLSDDVEEFEDKPKYRPVFLSENTITLSNEIQLVIRFHGSPEEIHTNYDFVHAMNYYNYQKHELVLKTEALTALMSRKLVYVGSLYPICSLIRVRKFLRRGWSIDAGQLLKMSFQVSDLDLRNVKVLKEQLTGVDVAYFVQLISALESKIMTDDKGNEYYGVDQTYIVSIIDNIFS